MTDELVGKALYELNKLGTIMPHPISGEGALEVFIVPEDMRPAGAPKGLTFIRFVADLMPYVGKQKEH